MQKWQMKDPSLVAEALERIEIRGDERMGRGLKEIPKHVLRDMYQWGDWANRKQFWANLNCTPFCKLVGLHMGDKEPSIRLDPQSMAIHKAVMKLDDSHKVVLYAYFVANVTHDDKPAIFNGHGISRMTYYRRLTAGTIRAHGNAMRWLEHNKPEKTYTEFDFE